MITKNCVQEEDTYVPGVTNIRVTGRRAATMGAIRAVAGVSATVSVQLI